MLDRPAAEYGDLALARAARARRRVGADGHAPAVDDEALALLSNGAVDHAAFAGPVVGLDGLLEALVESAMRRGGAQAGVDPGR